MSDPVITSQAEESQSWYSPLVDSAKSYLRPLYDEGVELLEEADRYVEEKKKQAYGAYNYVVETPAEKMAADALGYVQRRYPEQTEAMMGLAKKMAPSALRIYRAITPDPVESFINSQVKEFLQKHEEGAEVLAETLGGEALVQSLNEFIREETVAMIEPVAVIETSPIKETPPVQNPVPIQKKVEQKTTSVAVVEEDAFYAEEIPAYDDEEIISAGSEPADSPLAQVSGDSVAVLGSSVFPTSSNSPELTFAKVETTPQVEPAQEGKPTHVVETVETPMVVVSTEEGVKISSSDFSPDFPVESVAFSGDVQNEPKAVRQTTFPTPQPVTPEAPEGMIPVHISDERIDFGDQTETLPDVLLVQNSDDQAPILPFRSSSPSFSSSGALNPDKNPLQQIDAAIEREAQSGNQQPIVVPSFRAGTQAAAHRDLQADEGETRTVAQGLDGPLNDIPGSADKGFDSDGRGRDSKELMFALADASIEDKQEVEFTLEDAILPSSLRADVFLTT